MKPAQKDEIKLTSKGQITIPLHVRDDMGLKPAETKIAWHKDNAGKWYIKKVIPAKGQSRFHTAHQKAGKSNISTEELMKLTRGE